MKVDASSTRRVRSLRPRALLAAAAAVSALATGDGWCADPPNDRSTVEHKGVKLTARVEPFAPGGNKPSALTERGFARVTLEIADTTTGRPVSGLTPGGWFDLLPEGVDRTTESCNDKVRSFLSGGLLSTPATNLNRFYVLILNGDGTVSIVDPQLQFGGSRLLATIRPSAPAIDWAIDPAGLRVWLAIPEQRQLLEVETFGWKPVRSIQLPIAPTSVLIQPGSGRVWAVGDTVDGTGAVIVVDPDEGKIVSQLPIGAGPHELVFETDGRYAIVTSFKTSTIAMIDAAAMNVARTERVDGELTSLSWSVPAAAATVVERRSGSVYVFDPTGRRDTRRVVVAPGITRAEAAPDVPYAVVLQPAVRRVHVVDLARVTVGQATEVLGTPDEVSFSAGLGYVHHSTTENLFTFPIPLLGNGKPLTRVAVPAGQTAPGVVVRRGSVRAVTKVFGENAVLVAAPADRAVYYYREGMAAPMGSFKSYGKTPVGVRVIDRGFRETKPGEYQTVAQVDAAGRYDLVLLLSSPSIVQCVPFTVARDASRDAEGRGVQRSFKLAWKGDAPELVIGSPTTVRIVLQDAATGAPVAGATDLHARVAIPGRWQSDLPFTPVGAPETGTYDATFIPPEPGAYVFFFSSRALGMIGGKTASLLLRLDPPQSTDATETMPPPPSD